MSAVTALGGAVAGFCALGLVIGVLATSAAREVLGIPETNIAYVYYTKVGFLAVSESLKALIADAPFQPVLMFLTAIVLVLGIVLTLAKRVAARLPAGSEPYLVPACLIGLLLVTAYNGFQIVSTYNSDTRNLLLGTPAVAPTGMKADVRAELKDVLDPLKNNAEARRSLDRRYASELLLIVGPITMLAVFLATRGLKWGKTWASVTTAVLTATLVAVLTAEAAAVPLVYGVLKLTSTLRCVELMPTQTALTYFKDTVDRTFIHTPTGVARVPTGFLLTDLSADPGEIHLLQREQASNHLYLHKYQRPEVIGFLFAPPGDCASIF